jgi:hypothetical protein
MGVLIIVSLPNPDASALGVDTNKQAEIEAVGSRLGTVGLRPIKDAVAAEIAYDDIRLVVAVFRCNEKLLKLATRT